jgi:hypothetical protein
MKRLSLFAAFALVLAACGADNRTSIEVLGRAAPSDSKKCTYATGGAYQLGNGLYDTAIGGQYSVVLYVQNNLADPKALNPSAVTASNAWSVQAARVRVNPSDYVGEYKPSPALASIAGDSVLPVVTSPIVAPAGGQATIYLGLLSDGILTALQTATASGQVVLGVTLEGVTGDGARRDSGEWIFPLQVCSGCVPVPTSCATGTTLQAPCDGQLSALVCE